VEAEAAPRGRAEKFDGSIHERSALGTCVASGAGRVPVGLFAQNYGTRAEIGRHLVCEGGRLLRPLQGLSTCRSRLGDTVRDDEIDCGVIRMAVIN